MEAQTSVQLPDRPMTPRFACLLSAASVYWPISTGKERDAESGNDYFGARYYASAMGRFLSPDPKQISSKRLMDASRSSTVSKPMRRERDSS